MKAYDMPLFFMTYSSVNESYPSIDQYQGTSGALQSWPAATRAGQTQLWANQEVVT